MHRFIHRAHWFALLAFFTIGCNGQEGEPLEPALDEQVSPYPEGKAASKALTADAQAPEQDSDLVKDPLGGAQEEPGNDPTPADMEAEAVNPFFRYAHVTWRTVGTRTAEFSVLSAFRRVSPGTGPDGLAVTGDIITESPGNMLLCFGDGTCTNPRYEVIDHNVEQGWILGRAIATTLAQLLPGTGVTVTETEPNSSIATANRMNVGDDYLSDISVLGDSDYVSFTLTQNTQLRIRTVLQGLSDSYLYLYSSSGQLLASNDDSGGGLSSLIDITLAPGTYYVRAAAFASASTGRQTVQLRQLATPPPGPITRAYTGNGPYSAYIQSCCRFGNGNNYTLRTQVRFDLPDSSPVSSQQQLIQAPVNTPNFSFQIPATDAEGDQLTFRLASSYESGITSLPPGLAVSSSGLVTWNTTGIPVGSTWSIQAVIEERRNGQLIGFSTVDFLVRVVTATTQPPVCIPPSQTTYVLNPGESVSFRIGTSDPNAGDVLNLSATGVPSNAYLTQFLPMEGPSGIGTSVFWTPYPDMAGRTVTMNFMVMDAAGLSATCPVTITVQATPTNRPPVANAGPDQTRSEGAQVMLDGRGSRDPDGQSLSYSWSLLSSTGPTVTLSSPTSSTPTFTPGDNGVYTFLLTVTDPQGATGSDTVTVTVTNAVPMVSAHGGTIAPGTVFTAAGSITDPGSDTWTATVDYGDGSGVQPLALQGRAFNLSHLYDHGGTYLVTISVTDDDGGVGTTTVEVMAVNVPPEVSASGGSADEGSMLTASGSFTDPGSTSWTATVDYGDGSGWEPLALDGQSFTLSHVYADEGVYTVSISVTDDEGATGSAEVRVVVNNVAPVVSATGATIDEGSTFVSSGSFTDPGVNDSWSVLVDYGDSSGAEWVSLNDDHSFTLEHLYSIKGNYLVTITIFDGDDGVGTLTVPVVVNNVPPVVEIMDMLPAYDGDWWGGWGSISDPSLVSWTGYVDYGDGTGQQTLMGYGNNFWLDHIYEQPGTYTVTVTVMDEEGAAGTATAELVVNNMVPSIEVWGINDGFWEGQEFGGAGAILDSFQASVTATIDYGDGSGPQPLELYADAWSMYRYFYMNHFYANSGLYTVTITATDENGATATTTFVLDVWNVAPYLWMWPYGEGTEGSAITAYGEFGDMGVETWTATVDYGDGSGVQPLALNPDKTFELNHFYADDGDYTVTITITDSDGDSGTGYGFMRVENVIPEVVLPIEWTSLDEGSTLTVSGSFVDPGADTWTATVSYGDGTFEPLALDGNTFTLNHTFASDTGYYVVVTVTDDEGYRGSADLWVEVRNVPPVVTATGATIDEGAEFTSTVTITDPGAEESWGIMVDYGDGAWEWPTTVYGNTFQLSHFYYWPGEFQVTIHVWDNSDQTTIAVPVVVNNLSPIVSLQGAVGNEGEYLNLEGSFSDRVSYGYWWAIADFGDGSGPRHVGSYWDSPSIFLFDTLYPESGTYTVTLTVFDQYGGEGTATAQVVVNNVAPSVTAEGGTSSEGEIFTASGSFTDPGPDSWTATADYGDGSGEQPLELDGTTFTLSHVYADNGTYAVTVRVQDDDGDVGTTTVEVVVNNVAPVATASNDAPQYWGLPVHFTGTAIDPGISDTAAGFSASWALGDGNTVSGLSTAYAYANPGSYVAVLTAADKDGGSGTASTAVTIQKRPSSLTCDDTFAVFGYPVTLSAQLADALPGAQLGGKRLTFRAGTATDLGSGTTSDTGLGSVQSPGDLAPGHYTVTVSFAEDSHYTGAQAHCELTVSDSDGHITGGGLSFANRARGGFTVKLDEAGQLQGELQFKNGSTTFHAHTMTALGVSTDRRSGWFSGTGEDGRLFTAYVEDNGEPGTSDVFKLWIDGALQTGDGRLSGGNIQIHGEALAAVP